MTTRRPSSVKPAFDALEDRMVPTTATFSNGFLDVRGTDYAETIKLTQASGRINVEGVGYVNAADVRSIRVWGFGGSDTIDLRSVTVGATIYAGDGNDFVVGSAASDAVFGEYGNDRAFGMNGHDMLDGGSDNDLLFGMAGSDRLYGRDGNDFLDDGNRSAWELADGGYGMDFNADVVSIGGTNFHDVHQRGAPTCGFLSTLSALARKGTNFNQWVRYAGPTADGTPQYDVAFWNGAGWRWTRVSFTGELNSNDTSPAVEGESWVILMQRAWIRYHGNNGQTWPHEAFFALNGQRAATKYSVAESDFSRIASALSRGQVVLTATNASCYSNTLVGNHAYAVCGVYGSGANRWVQVRNPWGHDGATAYGAANDGLVWVQWSYFVADMRYLAIA